MLRVAFKEWATVCQALAQGEQAIILRKGGIAEENGVFRPEHDRFWLYPTFVHQQREGVILPEHALAQALREPGVQGQALVLNSFAVVHSVAYLTALPQALALEGLHIWTADTVRQRFHYRTPGLYALTVRVYSAPDHAIVEKPEYAGCKTWVELDEGLATEPSRPVMDDAHFAEYVARVQGVVGKG